MNCEEYLEIVRWSSLDVRWSATESDKVLRTSVGVRRISDGIPSDSKQIEEFRDFGVRSESSSVRSESVGLESESQKWKKYLKMSPTDSFRSPSECNEVRGAISGSPREFENMQNKSDRTSFGPLKVRVGLLKFIKSPKQSPKSPTTFSDSD